MSFDPVCWRSVLIWFCHAHLSVRSGLFSSAFTVKIWTIRNVFAFHGEEFLLLGQPSKRRVTSCRLSSTAFSILVYSQLSSSSWGRLRYPMMTKAHLSWSICSCSELHVDPNELFSMFVCVWNVMYCCGSTNILLCDKCFRTKCWKT
jgi:hypothetical protein